MSTTQKEARFILVRPGMTDFDLQGRIKGTLDIPLNDGGRRDIARVGEQLRGEGVQAIYHSPCESAEQSADLLGEMLAAKTKSLEGLRNLDHGLWQGKLVDEVKRGQRKAYRLWQEQPETICPPGGETLASAQQRAESVVHRLRKKHKAGVAVLVVPEPLASILKAYLLQEDVGDLWKAESKCGQWECIAIRQTDKLVPVSANR